MVARRPRLYFTSNPVKEPYYLEQDANVYSVPAAGGEVVKAADIDGAIGDYSLSPDGRRIALVGSLNGKPTRSYDQPDLFVADVGPTAVATNLTAAYDYDVDGGATGDQRAPRGAAALVAGVELRTAPRGRRLRRRDGWA